MQIITITYLLGSKKFYFQKGSEVKETLNGHSFLLLTLLIHALSVSPLTSISQAPQLPVKQPVGISIPTFSAIENQSSPSEANISILFGPWKSSI